MRANSPARRVRPRSFLRRHGRSLLAGLGLLWAPVAVAQCAPPALSDAEMLALPDVKAVIEEAASIANAHGRLWRIEGETPSYLVGTFHVPGQGIEEPGPVITDLVKNASRVFLELDQAALDSALLEWASDPAKVFRDDGSRLSDGMSEAEIEAAKETFARYGMPFALADQMRPFMLFATLSVPPCALSQAASGAGLDANIEAIARENNVPVTALETTQEQFDALMSPEFGGNDDIVRLALAMAVDEETFQLTQTLYRTGHLGAIWAFGKVGLQEYVGDEAAETMTEAMWNVMLTQRNQRMVERMQEGLEDGGAVVAVGGLHLVGDDGLVELLRNKGYTLTRVGEGVAGGGQN
ncbi:MAG: TraB/GumN family protein [Pseudomonadota bacterium]